MRYGCAFWGAVALVLAPMSAQAQGAGSGQIERGRYMVLTGHCNNCHTAGYAPREGDVPKRTGSSGAGRSDGAVPGGRRTPPIFG